MTFKCNFLPDDETQGFSTAGLLKDYEDGKQLFTAEDLASLMSKSSASAFLRLQDAVLKFSGLTEESRRELEKNLLIEQTGEPGSVSARTRTDRRGTRSHSFHVRVD